MSKVLSVEEITELESFQPLAEKQRVLVIAYVTNGRRKVAATETAYRFKSAESARVASYAYFKNPKIVRCLNEVFGVSVKDQFLAEIDEAIRNSHTTMAQVEALRQKGRVLGLPVDANPLDAEPVVSQKTKAKNRNAK